jgi:hypothetical protein
MQLIEDVYFWTAIQGSRYVKRGVFSLKNLCIVFVLKKMRRINAAIPEHIFRYKPRNFPHGVYQMTGIRAFAAIILALGLSACGSYDMSSRNVSPEEALRHSNAATTLSAIHVVDAKIIVPRSLKVSEANSYLPAGDIVWRGDPYGDRYVQIEAILNDSMKMARSGHKGAVPAVVEIKLNRFHALTEKTRYSVGGVHSVRFDLTLRDPQTGQALAPTREIRADLKEYGGNRAMEAERQGLTQKVRLTHHLANVFRAELAQPGSMSGKRGMTHLVAGLETKN